MFNPEAMYKDNSPISRRMLATTEEMFEHPSVIEDAAFQHSVLCQTFLPYRNPGDERTYYNRQGRVSLLLEAGHLLNPKTEKYEEIGLPYGARARLILAYLNTRAVQTQSPVIDVEESMTAFIRKIGLGTDGRTLRSVKEQIRRIAASRINLGYSLSDEEAVQTDLKFVKSVNLWLAKDDRQRVLWTSTIRLSDDYFNNLMDHAIPLDERALASLAHNALALDIYSWLAQRLHRVRKNQEFISWKALKDQFGRNYSEMKKFKQKFRATLKVVLLHYPDAAGGMEEDTNKGFYLRNRPSPIPKLMRVQK